MAEEVPVEGSRDERDVRAGCGLGTRYVGGIQVPSNGWRLGEVLRSLYARRGRQNAEEIMRGRTSQFRLQTTLLYRPAATAKAENTYSSVLKQA